ncbi:Hsp90 co-chaperone Cdc37 [Thelohanellus kitauei]|uniref:Hsp90 co-chaperone Cdc37 n=1 Tax=Thelohanellus kitauei TaxID=669202 RepID=A0A0C2M9X8_THEKT|nr:Hsp90 co-chaperone Cdc37 [Thelohanellus kitauei]
MDKEYLDSYNSEVEAFKKRVFVAVDKRRLEKAKLAEQKDEEEVERELGPGGLDPIEVMQTLPPDLQDCFISRDVEMLKRVLSSMSPEDAKYHFQRCIDSGLWVANAQDDNEEEENEFVDVNDDGDDAKAEKNEDQQHDQKHS